MREAIKKLRDRYIQQAKFADADYAHAYRNFVEALNKILKDHPE